MKPNYYETLGIAETATADEIKAAYRSRVKEHHPDLNGGSPDAAERLKAVNAAYEVLGNATKRATYDLELRLRRLRAQAASATTSRPAPASGQPTPFPQARSSGPSAGEILGGVALGWGFAAVLDAMFGSRSTWDPSVGRYRGPDGRFTSR